MKGQRTHQNYVKKFYYLVNNMELQTLSELIKLATTIIGTWSTKKEDIKTLTQIRFFMALKYRDVNMEWSSKEGLYNGERVNKTVELQETMAVGKAENQAKALAEINNWDYRTINADAQGIGKILDTISWYIINCQVENKTWDQTQF